jgi:hypothetical protein
MTGSAKQSNPRKEGMDYFVALLLAMTLSSHAFNIPLRDPPEL